jgi:hypothetical protein
MRDNYILLTTKDRPAVLKRTLENLKNINIQLMIIDDSTSSETYKMIVNEYKDSNIIYHGRIKQSEYLKKFKNLEHDGFIRPLGTESWNLGYVRNYALIISKLLGYTKVLFIDEYGFCFIGPKQDLRLITRLNNSDTIHLKMLLRKHLSRNLGKFCKRV